MGGGKGGLAEMKPGVGGLPEVERKVVDLKEKLHSSRNAPRVSSVGDGVAGS